MITDKVPKPNLEPAEEIVIPETVAKNPLSEIYFATSRAIEGIRANPEDPLSPPLFKTIELDRGQFQRIVRNENMERDIPFPAVFIHFVNVRYLVQQQRVGEGRATMRVRFILNTLDNHKKEKECEPFEIFQKINQAIQDAKSYEPALNERCNLTYFDTPLTTNMLQAYWIDYEVWFRENSAWEYRKWIPRYIVMPPFTNHSDAPDKNVDNHPDHMDAEHSGTSGITTSIDNWKPEDGAEEASAEK